VRLKGGCWDSGKAIFLYTTSNHIKYVLCNGDRGIVRGLESPVYVTKLQGNSLFCLDREGKMRTIEVDLIEALFKISLENKEYAEVMKMVKHSRLCGQSIITYLQEKGYPEVALHFVHDNRTRFKLALACGNIQVALNVAYELDEDAWHQLGTEALRQGNYEIVEMAYQKTKNFEQLSFLYLITGNTEKLRKMLKIAEMRGDVMSAVHNALYLGDVDERVRAFETTGQHSLAYLTAATHVLDSADRLKGVLDQMGLPIPEIRSDAALLLPPTPIIRADNWPFLSVSKSMMAQGDGRDKSTKPSMASAEDDDVFHDTSAAGNWGDDDLFDDEPDTCEVQTKPTGGKSGWEEDDLDLSDDEEVPTAGSKAVSGGNMMFSTPTTGNSPALIWCGDSSHCADHFAAGAVETAIQLLNRQIGAINVKSIKPFALPVFVGAQAYLPGVMNSPASRNFVLRDGGKSFLPAMVYTVSTLLESLKQAYRLFTSAQFDDCRSVLVGIVSTVPLTPTATKSESDDLRELLSICKEYLVALNLKSSMDISGDDVVRSLELAAYFTHCNLQPSHMILALKTAMAVAFKNKVCCVYPN
jgi:coatomer subunit alpha